MVSTLTSRRTESIGDEFERLVARTRRKTYNLAYRMTMNRDDAEDLTQETYVRAWGSFHKYNRTLPFENWIFRILTNRFIDGLRRKHEQMPLSLDQPLNDASETDYCLEIPDDTANPETRLVQSELGEQVQNALSQLDWKYRIAVKLCDADGLSYDEIAEATGTSLGTVRSRIHRGRKSLREHLAR